MSYIDRHKRTHNRLWHGTKIAVGGLALASGTFLVLYVVEFVFN